MHGSPSELEAVIEAAELHQARLAIGHAVIRRLEQLLDRFVVRPVAEAGEELA